MRGDSIRDLYAKTLALLGLGVLAGTGALVDYWPSGVALPRVEAGFATQPELTLALAVPEDAFEVDAIQPVAAPRRPRQLLEPDTVALASFIPASSEFTLSAPEHADLVQPVALARPAVLTPLAIAAANELPAGLFGEELSLSEPPLHWTDSALAIASAAPVATSDDDDHGVLSGVVRATKSSLVLTGRKTGASIIGAFRAVSGAVKKALPN